MPETMVKAGPIFSIADQEDGTNGQVIGPVSDGGCPGIT